MGREYLLHGLLNNRSSHYERSQKLSNAAILDR